MRQGTVKDPHEVNDTWGKEWQYQATEVLRHRRWQPAFDSLESEKILTSSSEKIPEKG